MESPEYAMVPPTVKEQNLEKLQNLTLERTDVSLALSVLSDM